MLTLLKTKSCYRPRVYFTAWAYPDVNRIGVRGRMPLLVGCAKSSGAISCRVVPEETKGLNVCKDTVEDDTWHDIPLVITCPHMEVGLISITANLLLICLFFLIFQDIWAQPRGTEFRRMC